MFKSLTTSLIVRGILALAIGVIALAWPSVTVLALVIVFAIYAFIAYGTDAMRAFSSARAGPVVGDLLFGLVDLIFGTWMLVRGIELRRTGKALHSAVAENRHPAARAA